ncbi:uncharacterized protein [Malus domestica]|uniref:uncharacterized protein n=1 Tax=Malus domestica TaxID=3750 RepID=UPI0010AAE34D|nr:uncharacterized protein LOC114824354 [Malus domestica]
MTVCPASGWHVVDVCGSMASSRSFSKRIPRAYGIKQGSEASFRLRICLIAVLSVNEDSGKSQEMVTFSAFLQFVKQIATNKTTPKQGQIAERDVMQATTYSTRNNDYE